MPRSPDLAIFVLTIDRQTDDRQTTDKTDHITPCACARGNKGQKPMYQGVRYSKSPL